VSAEDNLGIGGYDRIMGPNGQAQYWAPDLAGACSVLLRYYEHAYVAPGERFPRRARPATARARRCVRRRIPRRASELGTVGDIFSDETNPGRKQAFDTPFGDEGRRRRRPRAARALGGHARRRDRGRLDAHLGGWPVALIGIESRPLRRRVLPADGPSSGRRARCSRSRPRRSRGRSTPRAARRRRRARQPAGLRRLAGVDARLQLEYGAEIGRAVVNFDGPDRVLRRLALPRRRVRRLLATLNDSSRRSRVEGAHASVIGGARRRAVVFAATSTRRTRGPRIAELDEKISGPRAPSASGCGRARGALGRRALEKLGEWRRVRRDPQRRARGRGRLGRPDSPPPSCGLS
jgi:hypothetical protein